MPREREGEKEGESEKEAKGERGEIWYLASLH